MRKNGSNGARLDDHEKRIKELEQQVSTAKNELNNLLSSTIISDLSEKKFSGKYMYTYEEIAQKNSVNKNFVQKVADENGLARRSLARVK